jgi:hypothetical protein
MRGEDNLSLFGQSQRDEVLPHMSITISPVELNFPQLSNQPIDR